MIVLAELRYTQPLDVVLPHVDAHRAFLRTLHDAGQLVLSGPLEPRTGGVIILCLTDIAEGEALSLRDPFVQGGVAEYNFREWRPVVGADLALEWESKRAARRV